MFSITKKLVHFSLLMMSLPLFATVEPVQQLTKDTALQLIEKEDKPVIIDVFAQWCGPCKVMKPIFHRFAHQHTSEYTCAELDYDKASHLVQKWGVGDIPTIVVFKNKNIIGKIVGQKSADALKKEIIGITKQAGKSLKELTQEARAAKFQEALEQCSLDDAAQLLDAGVDVDAPLPNGQIPLFVTIAHCPRFGDKGIKMVQFLLDHGASTKEITAPGYPDPIKPRDVVVSMIDQIQAVVDTYRKVLTALDAPRKAPAK